MDTGKIISLIEQILSVSFFVMLAVGLLQVMFRYFIKLPLFWSEEMSRYLYIFVTFLGAGIASLNSEHIVLDVISERVKQKNMIKTIETISQLLSFLIMGIFSILTYKYFIKSFSLDTTSPAMELPMWIPISSLLLGGVLMSLFHLIKLIRILLSKKE